VARRNGRVRPPPLKVTGAEMEETHAAITAALRNRPVVRSSLFPPR
jgi:hypothetical protein